MRKLRNSFVSRTLVGVLALGMVFAFSGAAGLNHAQAQDTVSDLLDDIAALQAQLAALQGGSGSSVCPYTWTRDLSTGATGADVQQLQSFLNDNGQTVAASGAGSQGAETTYYGPLTASAVSAFQVAYAAQVLTPLGLTSGTGYFGPSSRAQANALCATASDDEDEDEDDDTDEADLDGETSLRDYDALNDPDNEDVREGDEDVPVFGFEFDVEDANALVQRVDVTFQAVDDTKDEDPYDYLDEVSLWFDGDEVARNDDASDEDEWDDGDDDDDGTEDFTIRFSGVDTLVEEGTTPEFIVAVSALGNLDSADEDQEFDVWVGEDGLRAIDGEGINHEIGDDTEVSTFSLELGSTGAELQVSLSSDNPDSTAIEVDEDDTSDDHTLLIADLEAEDADLEFETIVLTYVGDEPYEDMIADLWLEIDGDIYNDIDVDDDSASTTEISVDIDGDLEIDEGDEVEMAVVVEFRAQDGNYTAGSQVSFEVTGGNVDDWEVEAAGDELDATALDGSALGDEFALLVDGANFTFVEADASVSGDSGDQIGSFAIEFEVTAFGDTVFIDEDVANSIVFAVVGDLDNTDVEGTSLVSTADLEGTEFRVDEGDSEDFTLNVAVGGADGFARVEMSQVTIVGTPDVDVPVNPSLFRTGSIFVNGI